MTSSSEYLRQLQSSWLATSDHADDTDYRLIDEIGAGFAARTRQQLAAVVIPLPQLDEGSGRRAGGCELVPLRQAVFRYQERQWTSAGAALVCSDANLVDSFVVLAADLLARLGDEPTWKRVVEIVQEWQTLLAAKGKATAEGELGLWGELWFIAMASHPARLLAGWRGPECDSTDFFIDGASVEIKTSRHVRHHHVSQTQVPAPVGAYPAWLLSLWVKEDPVRGHTVGDLVARIEQQCDDPARLLRQLLRAGYAHTSKTSYVTKYVVLDSPEWYATVDVPAVRAADPGVSNVRYEVNLAPETAAPPESAERLWKHFHGRVYDHAVL